MKKLTQEEIRNQTVSERIRWGIEALRKWEQIEGCEVDMETFGEIESDTCFACLGGAAYLLSTCDDIYEIKKSIEEACKGSSYEDYYAKQRIEASLDLFRVGDVSAGAFNMEINKEHFYKFDRHITPYDENRERFYIDMGRLADDLEEDPITGNLRIQSEEEK